jgi:hypothetical protein
MNKIILSAAALLLLIFDIRAQNYTVDWYKVSGGGGTSSGAQYTVTGTIGQHDAGGPMTGGNYSITGGFWSLISIVPVPGAPALAIQRLNPTSVKISWPSLSTGYLLQQNSDLNTANWFNSAGTVNDDGTTKSVTISPPSGTLFFRLKK